MALLDLRRDPAVTVVGCLTTVSATYDRVSMHGIRRSLVEAQADALGLPMDIVVLPPEASNEAYEERMAAALEAFADRGVDAVAFGDLALQDVRAYREEQLADAPVEGRWPVWGRDTATVAEQFLDRGFHATVVCVDGAVLDESFVGRRYDRSLLADLPDGVDPCGENGEFHTFVSDGPVFEHAVSVEAGERVTRTVDGGTFYYIDLRSTGER